MAYAAVTSLMETLSLNFLQSQPPFPLEDLAAQMRDDANQNLGLLQQILQDMAIMEDLEVEVDEASSNLSCIKACLPRLHGIFNNEAVKQADYIPKKKKMMIKSEKQLQLTESESSSQNERIADAGHGDSILLSSRLREVAEIKQNIVSLHEKLGFLQETLEKSEICYDKDLEAEMRDVLFKAEERIEMELTTIYLAKHSRLRITACLLRLHEIFIEAQKQTDYLKNQLMIRPQNETITDDVSLLGRMRSRGLLLVKGLAHKNIIVSKSSKKASKLDSGMVGCHEVFMKILDQLTQQSTKRRQVVSIVGMGGIGKTTLARKVYEDSSITSYFDMQAWTTVSQEYSVEQMLRCLIGCVIAESRDELHEQDTDQLAERLRKRLNGQRYLIVIDDIWSTAAWDSVQRCFPDDNNGSRILLTSRLREVAEYASSGKSPLNMPFLDADESWNLYCKVFGKTEFLLVFEQIGKDIVKKCKGLPLAITIVASLLSKTEEVEEKWKNVAKSVMSGSNDACSRILYLSYNQLPHHLKACFLYFGIFEEDYEIPVKKLVRLWAAEGFLSIVKHVNMEKVAMECLQDLVDRSLVIVSKQSYTGEMKRIRIHDMLRDLCLREAKRENFLNVIGLKKHCRWISHTSREVRFGDDEFFGKSHSIHFTYLHYDWYVDVEHLFSHWKLLRVLDIKHRVSYGENSHIGDTLGDLNVLTNLVHLRYFALSTYWSFEIKLFEHWNMQSFIVRGDGVELGSFEAYKIWKMPLLRNFCIQIIFSLEIPPTVHTNLENLSWLDFESCTKDLFTMIPNLKKLGVDGHYYLNNLDWFYNCVHLGQLETLSIRSWGCLKHIPCREIIWATNFLPNLKKLNLLESNLQWSDLRLICMLPNLEVLKLINACKGLKWETYDGGFRRLKRLVIVKANLQYWNAVGDHFPILECLEISHCYSLEEIPPGFGDIATLALIKISYCSNSLMASAKWIQDEQNNNYGNAALLDCSKGFGPLDMMDGAIALQDVN